MSPETLLQDHNSDEEEESLSLCDLPIKQEKPIKPPLPLSSSETQTPQQDNNFEFGSWGGSVLTESDLCAADDIFFQGQILPLRFSVSSENGLNGFRQDSSRNPSRCGSRSESMEHCSSNGFTSLSSRSSSIKSHQSSSETSTSSSSISISTTYKPKLQKNNFHSHPSPKPQILISGSSKPRNVHNYRIGGKSTTWGLFRVGLVKTPEIELQDLKLRNNKSFSNSSSRRSSSSTSSSNNGRKIEKNGMEFEKKKKKMQRFLFESCKCSVDAVESVSSRIVIIKSNGGNNKKKKIVSEKEISNGEVKEEEEEEEEEEDKEKEKQGKQKALNHRRTFEWLKELSIADVPVEA